MVYKFNQSEYYECLARHSSQLSGPEELEDLKRRAWSPPHQSENDVRVQDVLGSTIGIMGALGAGMYGLTGLVRIPLQSNYSMNNALLLLVEGAIFCLSASIAFSGISRIRAKKKLEEFERDVRQTHPGIRIPGDYNHESK